MAKVKIYATPLCPYCRAARTLFESKGVLFEWIDVSGKRDTRRWLAEKTRQTSVPQIFIDGKPYGGFSDIDALDKKGELDSVLGLGQP